MPAPQSLQSVDWSRVLPRLTAFALRRLARGARLPDAEDIAREAIAQLYDPKYKKWDPAERDLLLDLGSRVNGIIQNRRRKKVEVLGDEVDEVRALDAERRDSADPVRGIEARQTLDRLLARVSKDELVEQILLLMTDGVFKAAAQAEALKRPIKDIYNARRRLVDHVESIRREEREEHAKDE